MRKLTDQANPTQPRSGWTFTPGKPAGSPVTFSPSPLVTVGSDPADTIAINQVPAAGASNITVTETQQASFGLVASACQLNSFPDPAAGGGLTQTIATVQRNQDWYCTFRNSQTPANVTIVKDAQPNDPQDFGYSGSFGAFTLDDDSGAGNSATPSQTSFQVSGTGFGSKSVTEATAAGWTLTGADCTGVTGESLVNGTLTFNVVPGANIVCTFTNVKHATVTVVKEANPEGATSFDFDGSGSGISTDFDLVDDGAGAGVGSATFPLNTTQFGQKDITETVPSGWTLSSAGCTGVTPTPITNGVRFTVVAGANITCTFTNTQHATLTVVKEANPEGSTSFDFDATGTGVPADIDLVDDGGGAGVGSQTFNLNASQLGTKTITETVPSGWTLSSADCDSGDTPIANGVSVNVAAGANITCTFTNTKHATLTVVKEANPEGATSFDFDTSGTGMPADIDLVDDGGGAGVGSQTISLNASQLGTKTITETVPSGWTLSTADCDSGDTPITNGVSVNVTAGANITCTFTNTQHATVAYQKVTAPASDPQDFVFTTSGAGLTGDTLDTDGGSATPSSHSNTLTAAQLAGTKTITEALPAGWSLTSVDCTGVAETPVTNGVSFTVVPGADITCTFTNTKHATVTYEKVTDPAGDPADFAFDASGTGMTDATLDTDPGSATPSSHTDTLTAAQLSGTKSIAETLPSGWTLTNVGCTNTTATRTGDSVSFAVEAGDAIVCTFTNVKGASVTYQKVTDPAADQADFVFTTTGTGMVGDTLDTDPASAGTPSFHSESFDAGELAGTKTITEAVPSGWTLTDVSCTNTVATRAGNQVTFAVDPGDAIVCTFTNVKDAKVTYRKVTDPATDIADFAFDATGAGLTDDTLDTDPAAPARPRRIRTR